MLHLVHLRGWREGPQAGAEHSKGQDSLEVQQELESLELPLLIPGNGSYFLPGSGHQPPQGTSHLLPLKEDKAVEEGQGLEK